MDSLVSYDGADGAATVTMEDGKVNVMSLPMQAAIHEALDRAAADGAVVVLAGRTGIFSAGFDLATLRGGGPDGPAMARGGFALAARGLEFPHPAVAACTGHPIAVGAFLLCSCDHPLRAAGPVRFPPNRAPLRPS